MSELAIALNRFGLGARGDESPPANPRAWLTGQLDRFEPRPPPIAAAPSRAEVAGQLADYLEEARREGRGRRRAMAPQPASAGQGMSENDQLAGLPDSARRFVRQASRRNYLAMVAARTGAALTAPAPFVERMVHFWANHFAVSADKLTVIGLAGLLEFEAIRPHVLGRFGDMLLAVEQHPAMLLYLDQAQSIGPDSDGARIAARFGRGRQRRGLNENLAREILELHTLGVDGGYAQADVTEFARALTGWTVGGLTRGPAARFVGVSSPPGSFLFAERIHEPGPRTLLGRSYGQEGEAQARAMLANLAADPRTARHLAHKLARHFAGDDPPAAMVRRLERAWLASGGDLPTVYRAIVDSPEAWAPAQIKFRPPWDWSIAALRALGVRHVEPQPAAGLLAQLGQPVWRPGSPAGYDDIAASWSGPDALMRRVEAAERLAARAGGQADARALAPRILPGALSAATGQAIARAESPGQGLALLLVAPEFLRR
ncbi:MAG TPA: DUF1800 domain-containing protein [Allosphingosinicella sp.]|nr:DUF1800 domain-containing protein [Allosphingosinicella sp.]